MTKRIAELLNLQIQDLQVYDDIELTEDETRLAILKGKQEKSARLNRENYVNRLRTEPSYVLPSAESLRSMLLSDSQFKIDEFNEKIVWDLCLYFTSDPRSTIDPKKGIFLYGGVGTGKTTLMKFFRHNQKGSFAVISTRQLSYEFAKHGQDGIERYNGLLPSSNKFETYGQTEIGICFDDLGTEEDKKFFGNGSNVLAELLLNRYESEKMKGMTHMTTNLNQDEIESRYGVRVRSRMREMFNVLAFPNGSPDRRR